MAFWDNRFDDGEGVSSRDDDNLVDQISLRRPVLEISFLFDKGGVFFATEEVDRGVECVTRDVGLQAMEEGSRFLNADG